MEKMSFVSKGILFLVTIILLLSIFSAIMPTAMDAGDDLDYSSVCTENLGSSGVCGQWDPGSDYDDFSCSQNYEGGITTYGNWSDSPNQYDMDWETYGECNGSESCYYTFTFYKPIKADDALMEVNDNGTNYNLSMDPKWWQVINSTHTEVIIRVDSNNGTNTTWSEVNATSDEIGSVLRTGGEGRVYDMKIYWLQNSEPCALDVAGICKDTGWNNLGDVCVTDDSDIPMGSAVNTLGILLLMILLLITIWKVISKNNKL